MSDKKSEIFKKFFNSKFVTLALILTLIWALVSIAQMGWKNRELGKEVALLREKVISLTVYNENLGRRIENFGSAEYLEQEARQKQNLKKPGEEVVIVPKEVEEALLRKDILEQKEINQINNKTPVANWLAWVYHLLGVGD